MEVWRQKTCQHQESRRKERNKTKSGYINSHSLQTQLCSCEPHHKKHAAVLFMSSRPRFVNLSCASNHMTSTHSNARQTTEVKMVDSRPVARPAAAQRCQEDMGSGLEGEPGPDIHFNPL